MAAVVLTDKGAEVIKVDHQAGAMASVTWVPVEGVSAIFSLINRKGVAP